MLRRSKQHERQPRNADTLKFEFESNRYAFMPINSTQTLADRLAIYLAAYKHYVDLKSKARLLDVAIFGEPFARDLAEIVFGYKDLVNLNLQKSFPAVDLGSLAEACAIQVTISGDSRKIVETQRKFFEHGLDDTYSKLKFIVLRDKQGSYDSQQIVRQCPRRS